MHRYEWGHGTPVDESMAEHFYRQAIALAEKDKSGTAAADKAEPAAMYFTAALLKLHTRQRLREGWATAEGLRGRAEEIWAETISPELARRGLELSEDESEVQAAAVLAVVLVVMLLWRMCCANRPEGLQQPEATARDSQEQASVTEQAEPQARPHTQEHAQPAVQGATTQPAVQPNHAGSNPGPIGQAERDARLEAALRRQRSLQQDADEDAGSNAVPISSPPLAEPEPEAEPAP
jgi:hypothetical protein